MTFPLFSGAVHSLALLIAALATPGHAFAADIFVGPNGDDSARGSRVSPVRTLARARMMARQFAAREPVTVHLLPGIHTLDETLVFTPEDSGTAEAPVVWRGVEGASRTVISGSIRPKLEWETRGDGVLVAAVPPGIVADQLFVDDAWLPMARYPNFDASVRHFNGFAPDAFAPERVARWSDPAGGFIHAMHRHEWGDFHYRILGKDPSGALRYEGGWQNNRRLGMHDRFRMVENIREELDAPGEWYHDARAGRLYLLPPPGMDPAKATVEIVRLRHLLEFRGTPQRPLRHVTFRGIAFRHAARTFMDNREPLLRSDWTTYRGGAIVFDGTEDCALEDVLVRDVGGNAVFVNRYNRRLALRACHIVEVGANGIAFVGDPKAVRSPLFEYAERQRLEDLDLQPGPRSPDYPADCLVEDCLVHRTGRVEKQTAPVQIAMARNITVRHCSLYEVPRAGINIGDGCWGGHVVEFCDIFDTVLETGDHGSFNSWGRDRFWELKGFDNHALTSGPHRDLPKLDTVEPVVLRNNRWRCDHGWDIDLDDGSSNYEIRDNLCLNGGIKLREGFYRVCENNIMVGNSFHPHVWYRGSEDVFRRNIVFDSYKPIRVDTPWGRECDRNLVHAPGRNEPAPATALRRQSGRDERSIVADARFVDPAAGDYRVRDDSPALGLGFRNFPMDRFGVRPPALRALARTPALPGAPKDATAPKHADAARAVWMGAVLQSLATPEQASAVGVGLELGGVLVVDVEPGSRAERLGLRPLDLIQSFQWKPMRRLSDFEAALKSATGNADLGLRRNQLSVTLSIEAPIALPKALPEPPSR
ncbi:MAG: PDZ domain-containing protein [Verrucomicrobiales bacterium]|nr:PDZ domain-containing protein [Verrucomicrobiales bacterium]